MSNEPVEVTLRFKSVKEMIDFFLPPVITTVSMDPKAEIKIGDVLPTTPQEVRQRKPRSDAGKVRGPYKTTEGTGEGASSDAPAAPAGSASAPATSTNSATPAANTPPPQPASAPASAPAQSPASDAADTSKPLTLDDARAALSRINAVSGLGTPACIEHLKEFGALQITKLDPAKYAEFIKKADEKIAAATAKGKK